MQKSRMRTCLFLLFWLAVWQTASFLIDNNIFLVGPLEVLKALAAQLPTLRFWQTVGSSFLRIGGGFLLAFFAGIFLGALSFKCFFLRDLLNPLILTMKSVPVASFVILALIWAGSKNLAVLISFIVVFPMIYSGTIDGLSSTDSSLLEMARVFHLPFLTRIFYLYRQALLPYLISACKTAMGLSFKSGIAAEVIGTPDYSIGERLYMAKISLNTADLFAWTLVVILLCALFERMIFFLLNLLNRCKTASADSSVLPLKK